MWPKPGSLARGSDGAEQSFEPMRDELGRARRAGRGQHPLAGETCEAVLFIDRDGIAAKVDLTFNAEILVRRVADDGVDFGLRNDAGEPPRRKIGADRSPAAPRGRRVRSRARRDELRPGADQHRFPASSRRRLAKIVEAPISRPRKAAPGASTRKPGRLATSTSGWASQRGLCS